MKSKIKIAFREAKTKKEIPGYPPIINKILSARGVNSKQDIDYNLNTLVPYHSVHDIEKAAQIIASSIVKQRKIIIVADYDADGATSCVLCIKAIKALGSSNIGYIVPSRFSHGYGLSAELVEECVKAGAELIITVDNGITSITGVERANELGIPVIISDHHLPGSELPKAAALVNPRVCADDKLLNLAGVGVAFYLLLAVRAELRAINWFQTQDISEPNLACYLDLVALGTVADIAVLDKNNRTLVHQGLKRIQHRQCCYGIAALLEISKRDFSSVDAGDLGFALGPRLNAAGRLEDMALGIECLLVEDYTTAYKLASQLHELNAERRAIEEDMKLEAVALLDDQIETGLHTEKKVSVCLYHQEWHQGVIGILASRIKDRTHRPVVIFAKGEDGNLKGSARSIQGIHIRDIFETIDAAQPGIITKFGGHAMAAGLTIGQDKYEDFCDIFESAILKVSTAEIFENTVFVDGELDDSDISIDFADQIKGLGPWGHHFPQPQFYGKFTVISVDVLKEKHLKMNLRTQRGLFVQAIAFNCIDSEWQGLSKKIELVYHLDVNDYRGNRSLQLMVESLTNC